MADNFENIKEVGDSIGGKDAREEACPMMTHLLTAMAANALAIQSGIGVMHSADIKDMTDAINRLADVYDRVKFRERNGCGGKFRMTDIAEKG